VCSLVVAPEPGEVAHLLGVLDRLTARVTAAVGELDAAGGWALDGAGSLPAWLRDRGRMAGGAASAMARTARLLRSLPVTAEAWRERELSGGQVEAVRRAVGAEHVETFADQEAEVVPGLVPLAVADTETVMRAWRDMADDQAEKPAPDERPSEVYLDDLFDGASLTGHLTGHLRALVAKALERAQVPDAPGEHRRPAQRRADALGEVCRSFLEHRDSRTTGGRTRPHVNVVIDHDDLLAGRGAELTDGTGRLSPEATAALACDAAIHRVLQSGTGVILDYGRATRTVAAPLYNAVEIRDRGCRFPGCTLPPARCDAHHVQWWTNQGRTAIDNLVLLCWHHHHLLHKSNWRLAFDARTGIVSATGPDGLTRTSRPPGAIALPAPGPAPPAQRAA
jgi:hypothetical protein